LRAGAKIGLLTAGLALAAMVGSTWKAPPALYADQGALVITMKNSRISLHAEKVPLKTVLQAMADRAGIRIATGLTAAELQAAVTLQLQDVAFETVLKRLAASRAFVYDYHPERKTYTLARAGLFGGDKPAHGDVHIIAGQDKPKHTTSPPAQPLINKPPPTRNGRRPAYLDGELLVRFKETVPAEKIAALHASFGSEVLSRVPALRIERVKIKAGLDEENALALYRASDLVDIAGRHTLRYPNVTPNDPFFGSQWGLGASRAPEGWAFTTGGAEVVVAVIDTGVRYLHPDLAANIWTNPGEIAGNGLDDDGNGFVDDIRGWDFAGSSAANPSDADADPLDGDSDSHGTHVAGILGGLGNNASGIAGVAWNIQIMPLKVLADNGSSLASIDVIAAYQYALDNGARVVNCSFGGPGFDPIEYLVLTNLRNAGILVVCAAGNGDDNNNPLNTDLSPHYPSSYNLDNIISVAAGMPTGALASFSNFGPVSVDLMAPGEGILSTVGASGYGFKSGTSMATPFVAGTAGLLLARKPGWFYSELKTAVLNTVEKATNLTGVVLTSGRLNAHFAVCSAGTIVGDVTCDNRVDLTDSVAAMQIVSGGGPEICEACLTAGIDINGDLKVGLEEAAHAIRREAGL